MKKLALLVTALLAISGTALAADADGFIGTKVEVVDKSNEAGWELQEAHWITHGTIKGSSMGNFELGYLFRKDHNEDSDEDGYMSFEFMPRYNMKTSWGSAGGQVNFIQERWGADAKGANFIKPEMWGTYNLNEKSRLFGRVMYEMKDETGNTKTQGYAELEAQYKYDIGGGTAMAGVFYAPEVDNGDEESYRLLGNYAKFWPQYKVFTSLWGELRDVQVANGNEINAYKASIYANTPLPFMDGLVLEGEINRFAETKNVTGSKYAENFFMLGMRYNF